MKSRVLVAFVAAINVIALALLLDSFAGRTPLPLVAAEKKVVRGGQCYETVTKACKKVNTRCDKQECSETKIVDQTFHSCPAGSNQDKTIPDKTFPGCKKVKKGSADCYINTYPCINRGPCVTVGLKQCKKVEVRDPKNPKKLETKYYCQYQGPTEELSNFGFYAGGDACDVSQLDLPVDTAVALANGLEFKVFHY